MAPSITESETKKEPKRKKTSEEVELKAEIRDSIVDSFEIIRSFQHLQRQGTPAAPPIDVASISLPVNIASGFFLTPLLIANLVLSLITFGLNVSIRSDSPRLTEIRGDQLNSLAGLAGIPLAVVNPGLDTTALARLDELKENNKTEVAEAEGEQYQIFIRDLARTECNYQNGRSLKHPLPRTVESSKINSSTLQVSSEGQLALIFGFAMFWILVGGSIQILGAETTIFLGLAFLALIVLQRGIEGGVPYLLDNLEYSNIRSSQLKKLNRLGLYCDNLDEVGSNVDKAINAEYK